MKHGITVSNPIIIHMTDREGAFDIYPQGNGDTATFDPQTLPEWAQEHNIASADLKEFREWVIARLGQEFYDSAEFPKDAIEFSLLQWDVLDENGEVQVKAADLHARSEFLAQAVGLDSTAAEAWGDLKADNVIITKTYEGEGATLEDIQEGQAQEMGKIASAQ